MELEIIKKAWKVWVDNDVFNDYPHFGSTEYLNIVYAETPGQAKQQCDYDYYEFTEIKVRRSKSDDEVMYEGRETTRGNAMYYIGEKKENARRIKERNNLVEKIKKFPEDSLFYIQDYNNGFVGNSVYIWGLGSSGRTINPDKAQKYTVDEIINDFILKGSDNIFWESKHFESKISKHVDSQHLDHSFKI